MKIIDRFAVSLGFINDPAGFKAFQANVKSAQESMRKMSRKMITGGLAITGAIGGAVASFGGYEKEMAKIEGLVGVSSDQLKAWQGDIEAIARETGQGPKKLAEALFFITSAGLRGQDAIETLRVSARAAAVGLGEQQTVAQLVSAAMNAYGSDVLSAGQATDTLTEAVRLGTLEPATLAGALGRVLPVASAMGVEFNELSGLFAAMSKTGTNAEEAGTQIQALMTSILKVTPAAAKELEKYGMTGEQLRRVVAEQGLFPALQMINTALDGNKAEIAKVIPNVRALRGFFDLLGPQMAGNIALLDDMKDSTGTLDQAFGIYAQTLAHKFSVAMADVKILMLEVGQAALPVVEKLIEAIRGMTTWFQGLGKSGKKVVIALGIVGIALIGLGFALKIAAAAMSVFTAVSWPILLIIGIIAGLAYVIYRFRDQIADFFRAVWGKIIAFKDWLVGLWRDKLLPFLKEYGVLLIGAMFPILLLPALIYKFRDKIWGFLKMLWEKITGFIKSLNPFEWGKTLLLQFWNGIKSVAGKVWDGIKGFFGKIRNLLPFSDAKVGPLKDLTRSGKSFVRTFAEGALREQESTGVLSSLLAGSLSLPTGPHPAAAGGGRGPVSLSVRIDGINIDATGADANEIAANIGTVLEDQIRIVVEDVDSMISA